MVHMICTLFTGLTGKEGIFMRYSYEFKMSCVEMFRKGKYPDTPRGISDKHFHDKVLEWVKIVEAHGPECLKPKVHNRAWTVDEKLYLINRVLAGESYSTVALSAGINVGMLYQWVQRYKIEGYEGVAKMRKGRPPKEPTMKKDTTPKPLTESEREELIRLRAENEYIKAENEVIKKEIALRHEKWAAQLKAKKQPSSKNSEKKDIN